MDNHIGEIKHGKLKLREIREIRLLLTRPVPELWIKKYYHIRHKTLQTIKNYKVEQVP